jgi:hypothetical protein
MNIRAVLEDISAKFGTTAREFRGYIKIEEPTGYVCPLGLVSVQRQSGIGGFYQIDIVDKKIGDVPKDEYLWSDAYEHEYIFIGNIHGKDKMVIYRLKKVGVEDIRNDAINELI